MLVRWITNFLIDRRIKVRVAGYTQPISKVHTGIPQGSLLLLILYLFYNANLLEKLKNKGLCTSIAGFMDNINILIFGLTTQRNCNVLQRIHLKYETWAKRHGSKFNPQKYDLIHFTRRPRRYNMDASLTIKGQQINPSADIRILGVRLDSVLR
jgi:Reverse transcriptase (RNA-dependent DNA polymerase)